MKRKKANYLPVIVKVEDIRYVAIRGLPAVHAGVHAVENQPVIFDIQAEGKAERDKKDGI